VSHGEVRLANDHPWFDLGPTSRSSGGFRPNSDQNTRKAELSPLIHRKSPPRCKFSGEQRESVGRQKLVGRTQHGEVNIAPSIGIFWRVWQDDGTQVLAADRLSLNEADAVYDVLTHDSDPIDIWENWRRLGEGGLSACSLPEAIATSEHHQHPMGRVILFQAEGLFRIYVELELCEPGFVHQIKWAFGLTHEDCEIRASSEVS
jgi:hypothetical protein